MISIKAAFLVGLVAVAAVSVTAELTYEEAVQGKLDSFARFQMLDMSVTNATTASDNGTVPLSAAMTCILCLTTLFFVGELIEFGLVAKEKMLTAWEQTQSVFNSNNASSNIYESADLNAKQSTAEKSLNDIKEMTKLMHNSIQMALEPVPMIAILILFSHYRVRTDLGYTDYKGAEDFEQAYYWLTGIVGINLLIGLLECMTTCCCKEPGTGRNIATLTATVCEILGKLVLIGAACALIVMLVIKEHKDFNQVVATL